MIRWLLLAGIAAVAPNLVWLGTSTLRIENATDTPLQTVAFLACERLHPVDELQPGESMFRFLEACGDDSLRIVISEDRSCQIYVEGDMYHVDATIRSGDVVYCGYDDPLSSLLIVKMFW